MSKNLNELMNVAVNAAIDAGNVILNIYNTDFDVEYKKDESPLTLADLKANELIKSRLDTTSIPVLSEEGKTTPYSERKNWKRLWIVDPLDGTKEFVKKNGEFTVNIALVENNKTVAGVVYAPVLDILYVGINGEGAYKIENASGKKDKIFDFMNKTTKLPFKTNRNYYGVVASRSHMNDETARFIEELKAAHSNIEIVSKGSSLKLCLVAEGAADIYPRFAPTSEWDTAAGHAVVKAAGGNVFQAANRTKEVVYNKEDILNPWFIVVNEKGLP